MSAEQRQQASKEEVQSKVEDLKKELNYWEEYLGSSPYIAGSDFTLAGKQQFICLLANFAAQYQQDEVAAICQQCANS